MDKLRIDKLGHKIHEEESDALNFFVKDNSVIPSWRRINGPFLFNQFISVIQDIYKEDCSLDWKYQDDEYQQVLMRIKYKDSIVYVRNRRSHSADDDHYKIKPAQRKFKDKEHGMLVCQEVDIMYNQYVGVPDELIEALRKIKLETSDEINRIHLLCQDSESGLYTKELPMISADLKFDLDIHYGDGFSKFHELNLKRISEKNKGIILLHGTPGTGKSYYIRRLIRDLAKTKKNILYMPNNMVDMIGTPVFNNFLLDWADDRIDEEGGKKKPGILLVIEDAERVLVKRDINQYGGDGVSNILNSSDGILNDFLNIQVLATFNSDIKMIDEAILRKQRMLSIKEFNKLSKEDAQRVIDKYEIKHTATGPMSLADIFSLRQDEDDTVLLGDVTTQKSIGFK